MNQLTLSQQQEQHIMQVANRVREMEEQGRIDIPSNYSPENALQAAYFQLTQVEFGKNNPLINQVTPESVAYALQDMVVQGLSVAKKQGYLVKYGDKLQFQRSYHGTMAVVKRLKNVREMWANIIWKGDEVEVDYIEGKLTVTSHKTNWKNATGNKEDIEGAYCIIEKMDGTKFTTIMTWAEIDVAWSTSKNRSVQNKYPQEMAKRTVINRGAKMFINTSDDSDILIDAINRSTENEYDDEPRYMGEVEQVKEEIKKNANTQLLDFETKIEPTTPDGQTSIFDSIPTVMDGCEF